MSEFKGTPGEWDPRECDIAAHYITVDFDDSQDSQQRAIRLKANARLIAAAPTMREYIAKKAVEGDAEAQAILEAIDASR